MAAMHGVDKIIRLAGCALPSGIQTTAEKGLTSRRELLLHRFDVKATRIALRSSKEYVGMAARQVAREMVYHAQVATFDQPQSMANTIGEVVFPDPIDRHSIRSDIAARHSLEDSSGLV